MALVILEGFFQYVLNEGGNFKTNNEIMFCSLI